MHKKTRSFRKRNQMGGVKDMEVYSTLYPLQRQSSKRSSRRSSRRSPRRSNRHYTRRLIKSAPGKVQKVSHRKKTRKPWIHYSRGDASKKKPRKQVSDSIGVFDRW
jgi:hypothetical protein